MRKYSLREWCIHNFLTSRGIPDLPEIRKLMRASWWQGFTFGMAYSEAKMREFRDQAFAAIEKK